MEKEMVIEEINKLKKEKNAIILAHNYQLPEIQDIADLTGDSLELSMKAAKTDSDLIIFCGVSFMAETASIVCPGKKVILPVPDAGCAMADMIDENSLREEKAKHPGVPVVTYVNSTAAVKAESDICCTSANAVEVVASLDSDTVLMTPDKNLAKWVERNVDKKILFWPGFCPIHDELTTIAVKAARAEHPKAVLMAHPECPPEVLDIADVVRSTSGMLKFAKESQHEEFIVATEVGLIYPLEKQNPGKKFYPASPEMVCQDMKKTRLEDVLRALREEGPLTIVPEDVRKRAYAAVERMFSVPRG